MAHRCFFQHLSKLTYRKENQLHCSIPKALVDPKKGTLVGVEYVAKCAHNDSILEDKLASTVPKPYSFKAINTDNGILHASCWDKF